MKASRILITGGAGFIGSHLALRCRKAGHEVWILDDLSTGRRDNVPAGCRLVRADIGDEGFLRVMPRRRFEAVCHLAAQSSGQISQEDPARDLEINFLGTVRLLRWARENSRRFLYASSMAVYGNPARLPVPETASPRPLSYYGLHKHFSEEYVRAFSGPGFSTTVFRMFNVYGPGQNLANLKQGMVSIYLAYVLRDKPILVKGPLDRVRDFIYVDDVVDAWMAALSSPKAAGKTYNLGSGRGTSVAQLIKALLPACGKNPRTYPVRRAAPTPSDQRALWADTRALRRDLGWKPQVGLAEGLASMAAWARRP